MHVVVGRLESKSLRVACCSSLDIAASLLSARPSENHLRARLYGQFESFDPFALVLRTS